MSVHLHNKIILARIIDGDIWCRRARKNTLMAINRACGQAEQYGKKDNLYDVKKIMEKKIKNFLSTNIEWYPLNKISLNKEQFLEAKKFLDSLEDHDDVQKVYSNLEILE